MSVARSELTAEVADWLVSTDGLAAIARSDAELVGGADELQVVTRRRREGLDVARSSAAVGAAQARDRARTRWPDADQLVFTRVGLEQASDPQVSAWRATRFSAAPDIEDRAAGCGGDTLALAATGATVVASDTDPGRLRLLRHNLGVRGLPVRTVVADALVRPGRSGVPVHVDPGRRVDGRRVRRLAEHQPSVPALLTHLAEVAAGPGLAIVLGPGVDLDDPGLPPDAELEFVQLGRQLTEAVLWTGQLRRPGAEATATLLPATSDTWDTAAAGRDVAVPVTRSRGGRDPHLEVGPVGDLLIEVAPAAVRARLHDRIGAELGARRVATRRALLTVDGDLPVTPWWTARVVEAVLPGGARAVRRWLRRADERPVEIVLHGVAVEPERFRRDIGDPPGGPDGRRIELVRGDAGVLAVVTSRHGR